eukprot:6721080-Pyramimonas_sp.AAC.1
MGRARSAGARIRRSSRVATSSALASSAARLRRDGRFWSTRVTAASRALRRNEFAVGVVEVVDFFLRWASDAFFIRADVQGG